LFSDKGPQVPSRGISPIFYKFKREQSSRQNPVQLFFKLVRSPLLLMIVVSGPRVHAGCSTLETNFVGGCGSTLARSPDWIFHTAQKNPPQIITQYDFLSLGYPLSFYPAVHLSHKASRVKAQHSQTPSFPPFRCGRFHQSQDISIVSPIFGTSVVIKTDFVIWFISSGKIS